MVYSDWQYPFGVSDPHLSHHLTLETFEVEVLDPLEPGTFCVPSVCFYHSESNGLSKCEPMELSH